MRRVGAFLLAFSLAGASASGFGNAEALKLFDRVARKLELSTEQRSAIFFLLVRERREIRDRLAEEDAARRELRRAIARPSYDEAAVRDSACRVADAELAVSLLAARLYAEVWGKLDAGQRSRIAAAADAIPSRDALLSAAEEYAGSRELFLTIGTSR